MTREVVTVTGETTVHEAAALLSDHRISGLPVVDGGGTVVGVVSEFDLIARPGTTVGQVMSRDVVSVRPSATIDQVRAVLVSRRLKRVPVVDDSGVLQGLISRADLVRELAYHWQCRRCGNQIRARRPPSGCPRCGAEDSYEPAPPPPAVATCPTCGRSLS
jgi:CBS-domain-containing membrane protein